MRYGKVGTLRQVVHPRIRGALDPSHEQKHFTRVDKPQEKKTHEEEYFIPAFSIRRHLHRSEELLWETNQQLMRRRLGGGYSMTDPAEISLKVVERHRFIKNVRAAEIRPNPNDVRDLAYSIRDGLTDLLANAHSPLEVPLGKLNRFGYMDNVVAYEIGKWQGDRATYGANDENGKKDTLTTLLEERQLAIGAIALAFENTELNLDGIAPGPHLSIARSNEAIPEYRIRDIRGELGDLAVSEVCLGDPVIDVKLYPDMPSEIIYVKHAWNSLALQEA